MRQRRTALHMPPTSWDRTGQGPGDRQGTGGLSGAGTWEFWTRKQVTAMQWNDEPQTGPGNDTQGRQRGRGSWGWGCGETERRGKPGRRGRNREDEKGGDTVITTEWLMLGPHRRPALRSPTRGLSQPQCEVCAVCTPT